MNPEEEDWLYVPPPEQAELLLKLHPTSVGEEEELYIPAPPPPEEAAFPLKTQLLMVGLALRLYMPPP